MYICAPFLQYLTESEASVICKQLGYSRYGTLCYNKELMCSHHAVFFHIGAQNYYTYFPGVFGERVWPGILQCIGLEASLLECESVNAYCKYNSYLSVQCASELKPMATIIIVSKFITQSAQLCIKKSQSTTANFTKHFFPSKNLTFCQ